QRLSDYPQELIVQKAPTGSPVLSDSWTRSIVIERTVRVKILLLHSLTGLNSRSTITNRPGRSEPWTISQRTFNPPSVRPNLAEWTASCDYVSARQDTSSTRKS